MPYFHSIQIRIPAPLSVGHVLASWHSHTYRVTYSYAYKYILIQ